MLDLIWTFGDYGGTWSATFKLDASMIVVAHDGSVLGQFVLDLTKAILNGLGWEFLGRNTQFDGCCYVIDANYQVIAEPEPETRQAGARRHLTPPGPSASCRREVA